MHCMSLSHNLYVYEFIDKNQQKKKSKKLIRKVESSCVFVFVVEVKKKKANVDTETRNL